MKHWSIKHKVWLTIISVLVTVVITGILLISFLYDRLYIDKQIESLMLQGEQLVEVYGEEESDEFFQERLKWANESTDAEVEFTDNPMLLASGEVLDPTSQYNLINFEERQQLLAGETVVMRRAHPRFDQEILGVAIPLFEGGNLEGVVFLSKPLADIYEPFADIQWLLYIGFILLISIILFLGNKMVRDVVNPLISMKTVAQRIEQGDFSQQIKQTNTTDELGQLARSFNSLSTSLNEVDQNRKEFLANIAHELKTPLSYMKGYAEGIEEGVVTKEKGLGIIQKEANRLDRLVHDLLDLAQMEADTYQLQHEPIAFAELIDDVVDQFSLSAKQKQVQILRDLDDECIIMGDADRIEQVVRNLLDNALRYTPADKKIFITLYRKGKHVHLEVKDEGIGIPEQDLPAVKQRFYRVKKARERKDGGTGLGLSIVSQIIQKHEGHFDLISVEHEGTTAVVTLNSYSEDVLNS
ncbi:sensor histidine kinase [Alkalicoccobacillus porphyridii]|uniref:histidine kinase n=1 Tax=Alkalicoccobacillus porphyridii TaxID=2597270 RepID=A0A553ZYX3_9BACI|nr:HAMP domain-containing sensor histidine kinase [Alkalicoccobacillus porphyridii]TSB46648.1 HAMP domain-containing protein [Alkalicoccobacillus porphyridii]